MILCRGCHCQGVTRGETVASAYKSPADHDTGVNPSHKKARVKLMSTCIIQRMMFSLSSPVGVRHTATTTEYKSHIAIDSTLLLFGSRGIVYLLYILAL